MKWLYKWAILAPFLLMVVACAGNTPRKTGDIKYTKNFVAESASRAKFDGAYKCPTSQKTWKKETWKKLMKLANSCVQANNFSRVENIGRELARKEQLSPWGPYYLSVAAEARQDHSRALWMIELALKKAPTQGILHYQKARIYWQLGESGVAIEEMKTALRYDRNLVDAHSLLGQAYMKAKNCSQASKHLQMVLSARQNDKNALAGLAECREGQKDYTSAIDYLVRAINNYPREAKFRLRLAYIFEANERDYVQALSAYKKIKDLKARKQLDGQVTMNLNDKIKSLQALIAKSTPGEKLSQRQPAKTEGVRK